MGAMGLGLFGVGGTARAASVTLSTTVSRRLAQTHSSGVALDGRYTISNFEINEFSVQATTSISVTSRFTSCTTTSMGATSCTTSTSTFSTSNLYGDAFDGFLELAVNGNSFNDPDGVVDLTGDTLTSDIQTDIVAGIDAQVEFRIFTERTSTSLGTIRALYTLTNTSAADIAVNVLVDGNYGSDGGTRIQATSNADLTNDATDLWVYSNDQNTGSDPSEGSDPGITVSRYGTGAAVVPTNETTVADGNGFFGHGYAVTVPAGATRRVLVFVELSKTNAGATADAADLETLEAAQAAGLTSGLSATQMGEIVNYAPLSSAAAASKSDSGAMDLPGLLAALGSLIVLRRRNAAQGR